ncbi:MAG: glycosyltransferase 87 family protein [Pseudomonadota bacterium]
MPLLSMVTFYVTATAVLVFTLPKLIVQTPGQIAGKLLIFVLLIGLVARVAQFGTPTIIEDDYNRYLWDGAVFAIGESPFQYAPLDVLESTVGSPELRALAQQGEHVLERVNHPEIRTIYPPVLQAVFALSHILAPFDLDGWRAVLLLFELGIAGLILRLLGQLNRSPLWLAFYWWNPLVLKEIANSAHMEPVLMLPVLLASYLILRARPVWSSACLALGAGVKIWPLLLCSVVWRENLRQFRILIAVLLATGFICLMVFLPVVTSNLDESSGFVAFAQNWKASSAAILVSEWVTGIFVSQPDTQATAARLLLGIALLISIALICYRPTEDSHKILHRVFLVVCAIYLLSPSQTPWYFVWIAPFLCIFPVRGLILASVLLPLHYLFFFLVLHDQEQLYRHGVVWVIWVPVWALLMFDFLHPRSASLRATDGAM